METRIALIGIIVENPDSVEQLNHLLHEYGSFIVGRMGIPYEKKNVNIISVAIDAPQDIISACLLYTSPSPRDRTRSRMPSSA